MIVADHVAVLAAAGAQGSAVVSALERAGVPTRPLSHATAPLDDRAALTEALVGVDVVVFTAPLDFADAATEFAPNVAAAAESAGVHRIVFNANTTYPTERTGAAGFETRRAAWRALASGSVAATMVSPAVYLENLLAPGVLSAGSDGELVLRYPLPASTSVSWLSLADLGRAVAAAVVHGQPGQCVRPGAVGGITAATLVGELSAALGQQVRYEALDPAAFEAGLAMAIGNGPAGGVASIYQWVSAHPDSAALTAAASDQPVWLPSSEPIADWVRPRMSALV
ncbi:NmrA family NAD(P)-binding protein [Tsukamurella tyrosinosolvens]|uniref:NmrA family NAD(P)-binding protein n=1 Tax=Tsukamurella tyrosinosolvens TaxID=57704 RepID=UPI0007948F84|nr:NmrA family NAD(P)-binding protein [Tsukamurella tyrosinosolvens]KXP04854.1 hypothetical protein AXK59_15940 [Tsukamurella tyrosinosolvens]